MMVNGTLLDIYDIDQIPSVKREIVLQSVHRMSNPVILCGQGFQFQGSFPWVSRDYFKNICAYSLNNI